MLADIAFNAETWPPNLVLCEWSWKNNSTQL